MKKVNKKMLVSIAGITLLGFGSASLSGKSSPIVLVQKVNAATTKVQLKNNAYVYTKRGIRKRVKSLKSGRVLNAYSLVTITGKKYYNVGKGRYIKKANVLKTSGNPASSAFLVQLTKAAPLYDANGMNAVQAVDNYKYYGNYLGAPAVFNIKDRNPEHVAIEIFNSLKNDPYYESKILGLFDKKAFGALGLNYNWSGTSSTVGLVFIEVAGTSSDWANYYNAN